MSGAGDTAAGGDGISRLLAAMRRLRDPQGGCPWDLEQTFETIVPHTLEEAHEVAEAKPAPDPYLEACRRLGVEPGPDIVALEDSPSGVAAGLAAGLFTIGIPSVPGVTLEDADLVATSLEDERVLVRLGIEPVSPAAGS